MATKNEKYFKLGILGCGRWGINHVKTAHHLFREQLALVSDPNPAAKDKVMAVSESIPFTADPNQIFEDASINAVIVATPAETHYSVVKRLLLKGKNVLVEKPITLHSSEARELIALSEERELKLMVGHLLLYHPAILRLKQALQEDKIGKVQYMYSNRLNFGTVRTEENILWSFAPHDISVMQFLTESNPIFIDAKGAAFLQDHIEDSTVTYLVYPGNVHAHIFVSWLHPFKEHRLVVIGAKGIIVFEDSAPKDKLRYYPKRFSNVSGVISKFEGDYEAIEYDEKQPLMEEQIHFAESIRKNQRPLTDGRHALEVLEILEKAERSLKEMPNELTHNNYYINEHAVVDNNVEIGQGTKIWHFTHIQSGARIGRQCSIGQNVNVANNVVIGNNVKIQNNVSVYEGVTLEDYVFCGPSMVFTNIKDPRSKYPQVGADYYIKTLVKEGASLGANSTIVCGHTVGRFAFVGAGAVVTKDIPDFALVVGNPARIVGWLSEAGKKLVFNKEGYALCDKSNKKYKLENNIVVEVPE